MASAAPCPSRGAIYFQLKNHRPTPALVEGVVGDRWSPGGLAGAIPIYMRHPVERPVYVGCMSEFGGGADVQQIRVKLLVMIAVLPSSANS
jgi:hypothetical protein